ncbi:MAG: zinc ribbon domain-containing protein, partial [Actinobacteria bacterium]|nr:zinc ribbon domain-containing protein [Actinomycetota bacterium]
LQGIGALLNTLVSVETARAALQRTEADGRELATRITSLARRATHLSRGEASQDELGEAIESIASAANSTETWLHSTTEALQSHQRELHQTRSAASLVETSLRRAAASGDARSELLGLVRSIECLDGAVHASPDDPSVRELLFEALSDFTEVAKPMAESGAAKTVDLFGNTMDAVGTQTAGKHSFAADQEELLGTAKLALFDWAATLLTQDQPVFPGEFLLGAREDSWALSNYRLVARRPDGTDYLTFPLCRIAAYDQRAAGVLRVHVLIDLTNGERVTLNGVVRADAAPLDLVHWAVGARMWDNLPELYGELLESGRTVAELPASVVPALHQLPPSIPSTDACLPRLGGITCPACGAQAASGDRFCRQCGGTLVVTALPGDGEPQPPALPANGNQEESH